MALVCRELDLDPKRYPPRSFSAPGQQPEERAGRRGDVRRHGRRRRRTPSGCWPRPTPRYQRRLRQANALDFDDLIMTTVNILQAFPDVAEHYRRRFRHVLVDEYQDTNHAQYILVRELVGGALRRSWHGRSTTTGARGAVPPAELTVVGDADQSIYAFRGATIRNILEFEDDYPDATDDPARAELPLDPDDPHRRQRGHRTQPRAASRRASGPTPATARRSSVTSRTTSTTRRRSSPRRSTG